MSAIRDHDQLFRAFLDEGPEVLPDRVLAAIADDVHRQRQRASLRPWRFTTMRTYLAAAAVVLILVAGGGILWANRDSFTGTPTEPTASPSPTAEPSPSGPGQPVGELDPGATYLPRGFTQPFTFLLPASLHSGTVRGDIWDGGGTFRLRYEPARGAITFHDDVPLVDDFCHPTGTVPDVPDDVGAWLTGMEGLTVSDPHTVGDAGSGPTYWDIELGEECIDANLEAIPGSPVVDFSPGEHHRVYDVGIGNDHVVVFTWGAGYNGEGDEVLATLNPLTDEIVRSIQSALDE